MVMNVVHWVSDWQYAQKLADHLREAEKDGVITRLCFREDGWACFRTEDKADNFLRGLSEQCPGKAIEHEWDTNKDCGSSLWQDGRASRHDPPFETPEWYAINQSVNSKVKSWELCRDFHEKLDSSWERRKAEWQSLTSEQIREQYAEIAATLFCYYRLSELSWHKTWIAQLNQLADPLETVRDALLEVQNTSLPHAFDSAMWRVKGKCDFSQSANAPNEQSI